MPSPLIRILGIDPGLNRTGYGVVEAIGSKLAYVAAGVIRVPAGDLHERLGTILRALSEVIRDTQPHVVTVEKVFVNVNPQSTLLLGQARGAAICAAVTEGLVVHEYAALRIKQAVVGFGRADKRQVQLMVQRLLSLDRSVPASDAADALACAICHAHSKSLLFALRKADTCPACAIAGNTRRRHGRRICRDWSRSRSMIGRIEGRLLEKNPPAILVDANGVGYEIDVPMSTFYQLPAIAERVTLLTHLIVREDAHQLYGFSTHGERAAFRELIKISGVGARTALAVLSGLSVAELAQTITLQESGRLTRVPGIGKKTAERLLLELKGKLGADLGTAQTNAGGRCRGRRNPRIASARVQRTRGECRDARSSGRCRRLRWHSTTR